MRDSTLASYLVVYLLHVEAVCLSGHSTEIRAGPKQFPQRGVERGEGRPEFEAFSHVELGQGKTELGKDYFIHH